MSRKIMPIVPPALPVITETAKRMTSLAPMVTDEMLKTPGRVADQLNLPRAIRPKDVEAEFLEQLRRSVDEVNAYLASTRQYTGIRFEMLDDTNLGFAALINEQTGEEIKRIPPDEILRLALRVRQASGLFTDQML